MGQYSSKDCVLLVDGYNVLGINTELDINAEAPIEESTPFGASWATHEALGIKKGEITQNGFYDDAAASVNTALNEHQGESRIMCAGFAGNVIGRLFTGFQGALQGNFDRIGSMGKLHRCNAKYQASGIIEDGRILHELSAKTADGDTEDTPHNNTAATDYGGAAYLQLSALTLDGYTNIVVKVRHSDDGETFSDLVTFTAVTAAPGKQRSTIAAGVGSIKQYLATSWAFTGSGTSPSCTFFVGVARNAS